MAFNTYLPNNNYGQPMNYGNQYFAQPMQMQQPMPQPQIQRQEIGLQGKIVDSIEVVKAIDIPLNRKC